MELREKLIERKWLDDNIFFSCHFPPGINNFLQDGVCPFKDTGQVFFFFNVSSKQSRPPWYLKLQFLQKFPFDHVTLIQKYFIHVVFNTRLIESFYIIHFEATVFIAIYQYIPKRKQT